MCYIINTTVSYVTIKYNCESIKRILLLTLDQEPSSGAIAFDLNIQKVYITTRVR